MAVKIHKLASHRKVLRNFKKSLMLLDKLTYFHDFYNNVNNFR